MPATRVAAVIAGMLMTACSAAPAPAPTAGVGESPTPGVLSALPPCESPPAAIGADDVEGLTLPEGSVITKVTPQKPLTNVTVYVPMTPIDFEASFRDRDGVKVLFTENEIFEAEMLISNGRYRNFHKARATCQRGSTVLSVVAPEVDAKGLPLPAGATAPPAP